jgi:hypothetical protein
VLDEPFIAKLKAIVVVLNVKPNITPLFLLLICRYYLKVPKVPPEKSLRVSVAPTIMVDKITSQSLPKLFFA